MSVAFEQFAKIPRLSRDCVISEKIDGTNAQIYIPTQEDRLDAPSLPPILFGSRRRWITPENDNFGFALWATEHQDELLGLGEGRHFGEWWGQGIGRRYGMTEKVFSLFNVKRWGDERPACCSVVPVLYKGLFATVAVAVVLEELRREGSAASPGFMRPEGVVIFHVAGHILFKKTLENDEAPKGLEAS